MCDYGVLCLHCARVTHILNNLIEVFPLCYVFGLLACIVLVYQNIPYDRTSVFSINFEKEVKYVNIRPEADEEVVCLGWTLEFDISVTKLHLLCVDCIS